MARNKNLDWDPQKDGAHTWANVPIYLLMDIRDELQEMNTSLRALRCTNFLRMPFVLREVEKNTRRKKRVQPKTPPQA